MKLLLATTIVVTAALLAGGCATRKYVRTTTAPIQAKVDQVGDQTTQNSQQIQTTKNDLKALDEKATNGINAAKEMATTADHHAADALAKAGQADAKADASMQALRTAVANIDDYKVQTSATVLFGFDQFKLTDEGKAELDKVVAAAKADNRFFIVVEGFTDKTGIKEYNEQLSQRRADGVVQYLVGKGEIPIFRIHTIGLGDLKPVDPADTREARAKNRRVEVKLYTADGLVATLGGK